MNPIPIQLSVIIDTYNHEKYIAQTIESVLSQTKARTDIEIIVVDDGSKDRTAEIAESYAKQGKIRFFRKPNGGQASSLNLGYKESRGKIIAILDGDDYWLPGFLDQILKVYEEKKCHAYFVCLEMFWDSKPDRHPTHLPVFDWEALEGSYLLERSKNHGFTFFSTSSGQTFDRSVAEKVFPIPEDYRYYTDLYLHLIIPFYTDIIYDQIPRVAYRQHDSSYNVGIRNQDPKILHLQADMHERTLREMYRHDPKHEQVRVIHELHDHISGLRAKLALRQFVVELRKGKVFSAFHSLWTISRKSSGESASIQFMTALRALLQPLVHLDRKLKTRLKISRKKLYLNSLGVEEPRE